MRRPRRRWGWGRRNSRQWSEHSTDQASRVSTMDVGEEEGLMPVDGCHPARVHRDTSLHIEVMSDALAIDDGHPLALELQSLRGTVAKYQVFVVSFAYEPIS